MQESSPSLTDPSYLPRIGVPLRRASEEQAQDREKIELYLKAIEAAGGKPQLVSLFLSTEQLRQVCDELDGVVLPGSPADVDPGEYGQRARPETTEPDSYREQTDTSLLDWAFQEFKPVLAICFGIQILNVYRHGTLVQDIRAELRSALKHDWERESGVPEPHHPVRILPGSRLALLAETTEAVVNSSHHQSIGEPGEGLRVTARSPDGVVEAVELESASHWVVGVQWHPERQQFEARQGFDSGSRLSEALFRELVRAAAHSRVASPSASRKAKFFEHLEGK